MVELPEIVEKAKTIFPSDTRITFTNSLPNEAHTFDIVHTASALHYCEDWKGTLQDLALLSNKYFSLCDIPAGSIPTFVSLQNFYGSKFRHWFWNIDEFLLAMNKIEDMSIVHFQRYEGPFLGKVGPMPMENFPPEYRVGNSCNFILRRK